MTLLDEMNDVLDEMDKKYNGKNNMIKNGVYVKWEHDSNGDYHYYILVFGERIQTYIDGELILDIKRGHIAGETEMENSLWKCIELTGD